MQLGRVVQADIQKQYIRVLLKVSPESVYIGMPVIVEGESAEYYCIVTNVLQSRDDLTLNLSFSDVSPEDGVSDVYSNFEKPESMETYIDLYCLKIVYDDGTRRSFKTIPRRLSVAREATEEDVRKIYIQPLIDSYERATPDDIEVDLPSEFNADGYTFGFLASNTAVKLPVRFDKMVERPLAIVGMTGSGKTVTIKAISSRIIADANNNLHTRLIIFDVHNEYIVRKSRRKDPGLYDLFPNKVKIITLDPDNLERMGIHNGERFRIFEDNITYGDVLSALSSTNLSEKMKRTLSHIYTDYKRNHHVNNRTFYDYLMMFYSDEEIGKSYDSEGSSYQALHSRLRTISREDGALSQFIERRTDPDDKDIIEMLLDELKSSNPNKHSFIIHFGKYGKTQYVYEFVANLIGSRLYTTYSERNDIPVEGEHTEFDRCVIILEEAHKFIPKQSAMTANNSVFNLIARETRKYGLTLFIIDQMPSKLDEEIVAQLNNRIIHRMIDPNDIRASLAGLDSLKWSNIVTNLEDGESVCFGTMVDYIPTVIKSFYGDEQEFLEFLGMSPSRIAQRRTSRIPSNNERTYTRKDEIKPAKAMTLEEVLDETFDRTEEAVKEAERKRLTDITSDDIPDIPDDVDFEDLL